jgi:hypothetical protein
MNIHENARRTASWSRALRSLQTLEGAVQPCSPVRLDGFVVTTLSAALQGERPRTELERLDLGVRFRIRTGDPKAPRTLCGGR